MVVEADESDGTFLRLPATIAVVTNVDPEHLDFYGTFDACATPSSASSRMSRSTALPCCASIIPKCRRWWAASPTALITYGFAPGRCPRRQCAFRRRRFAFRRDHSPTAARAGNALDEVCLPMPGEHNVQNSLAAIVVARELGVKRSDPKGAGEVQAAWAAASPRWASGTARPSSTIMPTIPSRSPPRCGGAPGL
jgi:UDP-N-acetylmuramate--alanine ligase